MKLKYMRQTASKADGAHNESLFFSGSLNCVKFDVKITGDVEQISDLTRELKLHKFGVMVDMEISNNQKDLDQY